MPEREYFDYDEWMRNTGGDRGYGSPEPSQPGPQMPQAPAGPRPVNVTPPPPHRPGFETIMDPLTGVWRYVPIGGQQNTNTPPPGPPTLPIDAPFGGDGGRSPQTAMPGQPDFQWPNWQSAGAFKPRDDTFDYKPFAHPDFAQTSWDDVVKQPGYEDSEKRLRQQIEAGAAYKGMVRSGMAIGDLYSGLDSYRGQRFNEYDNRRFRDYSANRDNAFGAWQGNLGAEATKFGLELGADRDIYDRYATDVDRGNNFRFNTASKDFEGILSKWLKQVDSLTSIATAGNN